MTTDYMLNFSSSGCIQFHFHGPHLPATPGDTVPNSVITFAFDPDSLYYANEALGFAIIAISQGKGQGDINDVGIVSYVCESQHFFGSHINIFGHPLAEFMKLSRGIVVERPKKRVINVDERTVCSETLSRSSQSNIVVHDAFTEPGSGGSPIFNDKWQLVGIHQGRFLEKREGGIFMGKYGCLIKYILEDMYSKPQQGLTNFELQLKDQVQRLGIPFEQSKHSAHFRKKFKKKFE